MNKLKIFFVLSIIFFTGNSVYATSGACSSHGGVNCSAQISRYDKVMCNDGWTNSSVYYYESDECQASSCTLPSGSGCKTENDYATKQVQLNAQGGYLGFNSSHAGVLQQCRNEITAYQSALQSYSSCLSSKTSNSSSSSYSPTDFNSEMQAYCSSLYGSDSNYNNGKSCECNSGYYKDPIEGLKCVSDQKYCDNRQGINSHWNASINTCTCNSGYVIDKSKNELCVPLDTWCVENNGPNYYGKDNKCVLKEEIKKEIIVEENATKAVEPVAIIAKPKTLKPTIKTIPKESAKAEVKEVTKTEAPTPSPQIQEPIKVKPVQKPSIFKRFSNWFVNLF